MIADRIIEKLSDTRLIVECARCEGRGKLGLSLIADQCPRCSGRGRLCLDIEGHGPLEDCLHCEGRGKLGLSLIADGCPTCQALGAHAAGGNLRVVPLDRAYAVPKRKNEIETEKLLVALPDRIPDLKEREFLDEALRCYRAGAPRAAIVMCWNLAYDHLLTYILNHHLASFNAQWPKNFPKGHAQARISAVTKRDEFSELKESEVLAICRSAAIISGDVYKVLDGKLGRRNSAAHPSGVTVGPLQAEEFIDDIIKNVVLRIVV